MQVQVKNYLYSCIRRIPHQAIANSKIPKSSKAPMRCQVPNQPEPRTNTFQQSSM